MLKSLKLMLIFVVIKTGSLCKFCVHAADISLVQLCLHCHSEYTRRERYSALTRRPHSTVSVQMKIRIASSRQNGS